MCWTATEVVFFVHPNYSSSRIRVQSCIYNVIVIFILYLYKYNSSNNDLNGNERCVQIFSALSIGDKVVVLRELVRRVDFSLVVQIEKGLQTNIFTCKTF